MDRNCTICVIYRFYVYVYLGDIIKDNQLNCSWGTRGGDWKVNNAFRWDSCSEALNGSPKN
jgi:hypothetical protein